MKKTRLASCARFLAWVYAGALVAVALLLRFVGEGWWLLTAVMYVPRVLFALPLVIAVPAIVWAGPRWMLVTQVAAGLLVLFPLMGLQLHPMTQKPEPGAPTIRVMSFNVFFGHSGCDTVVDEVAAHDPDVVVLQAWSRSCDGALAARLPSLHVEVDGEFLLATRYPVRDVYHPPRLEGPPSVVSAFMRYTLETPLGSIDVYSIHPYSPRVGFQAARTDVHTHVLAADDDTRPPKGRAEIEQNTSTRTRQVTAVADAAMRSTNPVIIAGDTNLPALSAVYARTLAAGPWQDGFATVGNGLGYTFPTRWRYDLGPWMRIDRILAGPALRFLRFEVGGRGASDHCPVIAELGWRT